MTLEQSGRRAILERFTTEDFLKNKISPKEDFQQ